MTIRMFVNANPGIFRPQMARFGSLLIGAGLLVFALAILRGGLAYQQYHSPFDEVDSSAVYEAGFLPVLSREETGHANLSLAPEFEPGGAAQNLVAANDSLLARRGPPVAEDSLNLNAAARPDLELHPANAWREGNPAAGAGAGIPDRIVIPSIGLDGPIVPVGMVEIEYKRQKFQQWSAPDFYAAGWHNTSSPLGRVGNTVLNGHHNAFGEIFKDLVKLEIGDLIYIYSGDQVLTYQVGLSTRFDERFRPVEERLDHARWILPSQDERLTLITCWPYESNTHRVVIVAIPGGDQSGITE